MRTIMVGLHSVVVIGLLCQCATQHETRDFEPYFRTDPSGYLAVSHVYERQALESKPNLNLFELRRLLDLYQVELRSLSPSSPRFEALSPVVTRLAERTQSLGDRVESVKRSIRSNQSEKERESTPSFDDPEFKKEYFDAYRMWNRDENEPALEKVGSLIQNPRFSDDLSSSERFKIFNLQFRIAIDVHRLDVAVASYAAMRDIEDCSEDTARAGLLLSLTHLGLGDAAAARQIFEAQCDPDKSAPNRIQRLYWTARLKEATGTSAAEDYQAIVSQGVPGFYLYLAHVRLDRQLAFPNLNGRSYRNKPLTVSSSIHRLLTDAEQSLTSGLRSDASIYLSRARQLLGDMPSEEHVPTLLYLAHVFQATGYQLDAMRIYATVSEMAQGFQRSATFDFLAEMFPTPHQAIVSTLAQTWKIDPDFIYAIMRQESGFNPGAVSPADARGMMQLMPFLGEQIADMWRFGSYYSKRSLFFAQENLKFAAFHLYQLQRRFQHPALMAAAYNAGTNRATAWWKRNPGLPLDVFVELIPVGETRNYVKLVLRNLVFYRLLREKGRMPADRIPMEIPRPEGYAVTFRTSSKSNRVPTMAMFQPAD